MYFTKKRLHFCWLLASYVFIGLLCWSCVSTDVEKKRPFRMGVESMEPWLNLNRPPAQSNLAGWGLVKDQLIGVVHQQWITSHDVNSRKLLWSYQASSPLASPLTIHQNEIFATSTDGKLHRISADKGTSLWPHNVMPQLDSFSFRRVTIDQKNNLVLVLTSFQNLYAIDLKKGNTQWVYKGETPESLTLRQGPAVAVMNDKVIVPLSSGKIVAVDVHAGQKIWEYDPIYHSSERLKDYVGEIFLDGEHIVMARFDGLLLKLDITTHMPRVVWQKAMAPISGMSLYQKTIYLGTIHGLIFAINLENGEAYWQKKTASAPAFFTFSQNTIITTALDGFIYALNRSNGDLMWYDFIESQITQAPLLFNKTVYIPSGYQNIYKYQLY